MLIVYQKVDNSVRIKRKTQKGSQITKTQIRILLQDEQHQRRQRKIKGKHDALGKRYE